MNYPKGAVPLLLLSTLLTGCEQPNELNADTICNKNSAFCQGLNKDAWCADEREAVVISRYLVIKHDALEKQKYDALLNWEVYRDCIEKASAIEFNKLKIRKTKRVVGYLTALQEIDKLSAATQNSDDPYLLWYHWGRNNDRNALEKFLAAQDSPEYQTPELQLNLATVYYNKDRKKTLRLLKKALSLYKPGETVKRDIIDQLSSLYFQSKDYPRSYIWSRVSERMGNEAVNLDLVIRAGKLDEAAVDDLEAKAAILEDLIEDARFHPTARKWL